MLRSILKRLRPSFRRCLVPAGLAMLQCLAAHPACARLLVASDGRVVDSPQPPAAPGRAASSTVTTLNGAGPTFNVHFRDVEYSRGTGFDDPTLGATRRSALVEVLAELGRYLNHSSEVDVRIEFSLFEGNNFSIGGSYYDSVDGVMDSDSQKVVTTGIDAYPTYPDMLIWADFSHAYHYGIGSVPQDRHDFRSKVMASALRSLGVLTLCNAVGESLDPNEYATRTRWESYLRTGRGDILFNPANGAFNGEPDWLIGSENGVVFYGPQARQQFGRAVPTFTPTPYRVNHSLTTWQAVPATQGSLLTDANAEVGTMHREPTHWELAALRDLGYSTRSVRAAADSPWQAYQ